MRDAAQEGRAGAGDSPARREPWFSGLEEVSPRPWYFDGRDIFSVRFREGGHRLVIPLPDPTWHPSQRVSEADARFVVAAVNAYEELRETLLWSLGRWRGADVEADQERYEAAYRLASGPENSQASTAE